MKRTALITGGTRGIGLGIAQALAAEKWDLVVNGVRPESDIVEILAELRATGTEVRYAPGDIGSAAGRAAVLDVVRGFRPDGVNLLVNNAGVAPKVRADLLEMSEESYDRVLDTNLKGTVFLTQAVVNWMLKTRETAPEFSGAIVNITSVSATTASVNRGEYCIAKAGLAMMTQLFAARLGALGIPVYEVRPGVIKTDMTRAVTEKYDRLIAEGLFVQPRWGFPEDVAKAVAAIARGDLPYSTGQVIMVDGGMSIPRL